MCAQGNTRNEFSHQGTHTGTAPTAGNTHRDCSHPRAHPSQQQPSRFSPSLLQHSPGVQRHNKTRMLLTCEIEDAVIPAPHHNVIHCQGDGDRARGGGVHRGAVILEKHKEKGRAALTALERIPLACSLLRSSVPDRQHCRTHGGTHPRERPGFMYRVYRYTLPLCSSFIPRAAFRSKTKQSQEKRSSTEAPSNPKVSLPKQNPSSELCPGGNLSPSR